MSAPGEEGYLCFEVECLSLASLIAPVGEAMAGLRRKFRGAIDKGGMERRLQRVIALTQVSERRLERRTLEWLFVHDLANSRPSLADTGAGLGDFRPVLGRGGFKSGASLRG